MKYVSCLIKKLRMGMVLLHECVQWINPECCVLTSLLSSGCVGKSLPQETDAAYIVPGAAINRRHFGNLGFFFLFSETDVPILFAKGNE